MVPTSGGSDNNHHGTFARLRFPHHASSCRRRRLVLGPGAQRRKARDTLWRRKLNSARAAGRGRVLESMSRSGCCSSACVQSLGLTGACMHHAATTRPRHDSFQTSITLTRRPLSVSRALHMLSSCVLSLAKPAVDLLEALDRCVCTRRARCFCLRIISHFCCFRSASSSGLARRRFPSLAS